MGSDRVPHLMGTYVLENIPRNGRPSYINDDTGNYMWWDSDNEQWRVFDLSAGESKIKSDEDVSSPDEVTNWSSWHVWHGWGLDSIESECSSGKSC